MLRDSSGNTHSLTLPSRTPLCSTSHLIIAKLLLPQVGYSDVRTVTRSESDGVDFTDVPPNFALPFKDWLARVWRVHGDSVSLRRAVVEGCRVQASLQRVRAEEVLEAAWEHDRDHAGPAPEYPVQLKVERVDQRGVIRKSRLAYRIVEVRP